ncbi:MAG: hypothetical protein K0B14_13645 [Anaerolineaceae bacterium]|nr:hypothetical protein [Anaerolineaceae bacterium]
MRSIRDFKAIIILALIFIFVLSACNLRNFSNKLSDFCASLSLTDKSGKPTDQVLIAGYPEGNEDIFVNLIVEGKKTDLVTFITVDSQNNYSLIVPLHPNGITGGNMDFEFTDEKVSCTPIPFTIDRLSPAPGAYEKLVKVIENNYRQYTTAASISSDSFENEEIPYDSTPLALAHFLLNGVENQNSLINIASSTAPIIEEDKVDVELLDALTAHLNLVEWGLESSSIFAEASLESYPPIGKLARQPFEQYSPATLSSAMQKQATCYRQLNGAAGDVLKKTEYGLAVVGLVAPVPVALISMAALALKAPTEFCAYTLPSKFSSVEIDISIRNFPEDYDTDKHFGGLVNSVNVAPASEGFTITGLVIDADSNLIAGGKIFSKSVNGVELTNNSVELVDKVLTRAGYADKICQMNTGCKDFTMTHPPETFPMVNVANKNYIELETLPRPDFAIAINPGNDQRYIPAVVGLGALRVKAISGVFGDEYFQKEIPVRVQEIRVDLQPSSVTLEVGGSQSFRVSIESAEHPEKNEWRLTDLYGVETVVAKDAGQYTFSAPDFSLEPSEDECDPEPQYQLWVLKVISTTDTGLRKNPTPERSDLSTINVTKEPEPSEDPGKCKTPTPTPSPDTCLIGTWVLNIDAYQEFMDQITAEASRQDDGSTINWSYVSGDQKLRFYDDYTYNYWQDNFSFKVNLYGQVCLSHSTLPAEVII